MCRGIAILIRAPETLRIQIDTVLPQRLGIPANSTRYKAGVAIGGVICRNGRPGVNGQPLLDSAGA
jgi:hypothetical protein